MRNTAVRLVPEPEEDPLTEVAGEPGSPRPRTPLAAVPPPSGSGDRQRRFHEFLRKELTRARTEAEKEVILSLLVQGADPY